jgi:gas vesicle protein
MASQKKEEPSDSWDKTWKSVLTMLSSVQEDTRNVLKNLNDTKTQEPLEPEESDACEEALKRWVHLCSLRQKLKEEADRIEDTIASRLSDVKIIPRVREEVTVNWDGINHGYQKQADHFVADAVCIKDDGSGTRFRLRKRKEKRSRE